MNFPPDLPLSKPSTVWEHAGITCATILGPLGSYNGYCVLPAEHELAAKDLQSEQVLDVHGGITYGPVIARDGRSVIGWDTCHFRGLQRTDLPIWPPLDRRRRHQRNQPPSGTNRFVPRGGSMTDEITDVAVAVGVYEPPVPLTEWVAMSLFMATLVLFIIGVGVWA